jgi:hypothetical protein
MYVGLRICGVSIFAIPQTNGDLRSMSLNLSDMGQEAYCPASFCTALSNRTGLDDFRIQGKQAVFA